MDVNDIKQNLGTKEVNTWCPGCPNFLILESVKKAIAEMISKGKARQEDFAMTTDIGCHAKIFDYLNLSGIYGLHGRALPTGLGLCLGNPNLKVLSFMGDGAIYSEGAGHLFNIGRFNPNMVLIVHDNQSFSLTTGQPTPTSQQGYKSKAEPAGEVDTPINPIKVALGLGIGFIARCNARDFNHTAEILKKAINYKGFAFVEIIQDCLIFNKDINGKDKMMYKVEDNTDMKKALKVADEWDYNGKEGKIGLGVLYSKEGKSLDEKWSVLKGLKSKGVGWKGLV
jgi:2-oxoglutarate/2-oxoacid ferredoxin oxidoreductase subunit beta